MDGDWEKIDVCKCINIVISNHLSVSVCALFIALSCTEHRDIKRVASLSLSTDNLNSDSDKR